MYRINRQDGAFSLLHCSKKASLDFSLAHEFLRMVLRSLATDRLLGLFGSAAYHVTFCRPGPDAPSGSDKSTGREAAMQQIADWLKQVSMSEYAQRLSENKIDVSVLRHLPDQDLKDIGVPPRASAEDARGHQ
jgi:SAM domain (Sterile alpha motif)